MIAPLGLAWAQVQATTMTVPQVPASALAMTIQAHLVWALAGMAQELVNMVLVVKAVFAVRRAVSKILSMVVRITPTLPISSIPTSRRAPFVSLMRQS